MNKILITIVACLLVIGSAFLIFYSQKSPRVSLIHPVETVIVSEWKEFTPTQRNFTVSLPAPPQYFKDTVDVPNGAEKKIYELYLVKKLDGNIFMINAITYPVDIKDKEAKSYFEELQNELIKGQPHSQLKFVKDSVHQGKPANDFKIESPNVQIFGHSILDGKTLYMLTYIKPNDHLGSDDYERFFHSFMLSSMQKN